MALRNRSDRLKIAPSHLPVGPSAAAASGMPWTGAVRIAVALVVAFGLLVVVLQILHPLALLFAAVVLAAALEPPVAWLERWVPRALAAALVYLAVFLVIGAVLWLILPTLVREAMQVFTRLPEIIERARGVLWSRVPFGGDRVIDALRSALAGLSGTLLSLPMMISSAAVEILLVIVMSIYWLIASPALYRFTLSLVPERGRDCTKKVLSEMSSTMGGFVRATVIDGVIVGAITYAGLLLIGVEFALVLALVAGIGEMIPMIGPFLAGIPAVAIAFFNGSTTQAIIVLAFYIAVQQVENHILVPYVMKQQADIPPLLAVFAVFAGAWAGGALWAVIAIPLAGALRVLVVRVIAPLIRRWTGAEGGGPRRKEVRARTILVSSKARSGDTRVVELEGPASSREQDE